MNPKIEKILGEKGYEKLVHFLSHELTGSELNSLLLEVFRNRAKYIKPSRILQDYSENRFSKPSSIDPVGNMALELQMLRIIRQAGFEVMEFSPLAPFGTASVHGTVDQHNVVTSLRRMEAVSDITNVMALEISRRVKEDAGKDLVELAASHRLTRAQGFDDPRYTAHFKVIGLVSAWLDKGKYQREEETAMKHISTYVAIFNEVYGINPRDLVLRLNVIEDPAHTDLQRVITNIGKRAGELNMETKRSLEKTAGQYYSVLRFGLQLRTMDFPVVDGGFVDWVSRFTQNKKRRTLISGMGTELMFNMLWPALPAYGTQ